MKLLLIVAGFGQIGLAAGSIAVPYVLKWSVDMAKVRPITRQIFHTYSVYIWATNLCFGLLSLLKPELLLDGSPLARLVAGFITAYWGARLFIQFLYYDRSIRPPGAFWAFAEWSLVCLFVYLSLIYGRIALAGG